MGFNSLSLPQPFNQKLTIGIVGFGNFGQFLAKRYASQGHRVIGTSRGDYSQAAAEMGCEFVSSNDKLMDEKPDVVMLCTSIVSLHSVLSKFPVQRLANTLVVDVLSVKMFPRELLLRTLPSDADILCTHPMFGPVSGAGSWKGLSFMYDVVRVSPARAHICNSYVDIYRREQCAMIAMSCKQHDQEAAESQFITHTTGRMLNDAGAHSTHIDTAAFGSLLQIRDNCMKDSNDLFYGLYKYNPATKQVLKNLESSLRNVREQLESEETKQKTERESIVVSTVNSRPAVVEDVLAAISANNYGEGSPNIRPDFLASMEAIQFLVRLSKKDIGQSDSISEKTFDEVKSSYSSTEQPPQKLNYFQFLISKIPEMLPFAKMLVR